MRAANLPHYQLHGIPSGKDGVRSTLRIMAELVRRYKTHPLIRELALSIVKSLPGRNYMGEAAAIQRYVQNHIRYVRDVHGVETLQTPVKTLQLGQGDCDDQSILTATLLQAIGHPMRFLAIGTMAPDVFSHVLSETRFNSKWIPLETIHKWPPGKLPKTIMARMVEHIRK